MTFAGWMLILVFTGLVALLARPMGLYLAAVFEGRKTWLSPVLSPVEHVFYRLSGVKPDAEQDWKGYAAAILCFSVVSTLALYALLRLQHLLPLNPQGFGPVAPNIAMNSAVSFVTNTNWQAYSGETTMSHLSQMAGLTVQNFVSAAAGIAVAVAFARGFARRGSSAIGNFWVDLTRSTLYVLLPLSLVLASLLNNLRRGSNFFKMIYFLPQITSTVAVALVFGYVFQPNWGLINGALRLLGVQDLPLWLADPRYSLTGSRAAVTILAVWVALGYYMLIFLAGLQAIPTDSYDAAVVDGAGPLQSWWYITLPGLRPTFVFLILTGTIDAMSRFSDLWTLGGPGGTPARSLQTVVMFMYQTAFEAYDFNLSSAVAVVLFFIVLGLTLINFRVFLGQEFGGAEREAAA